MTEDPLRLADRIEIHELRARYNHHYDDRELDEFVELFAADGLLQLAYVGWAKGHDQLRAALAAPMRTADFAAHFTTDEITEFTGPGTATGKSRFAVNTGRQPNIEGAGTYIDEYVRTPAGWRFQSRKIAFFYMGPKATEYAPAAPPIPAPPA